MAASSRGGVNETCSRRRPAWSEIPPSTTALPDAASTPKFAASASAARPSKEREKGGGEMKRGVVLVLIALILAGCASLEARHTRDLEQMLTDAGFQMRAADSLEALAYLQTLPARIRGIGERRAAGLYRKPMAPPTSSSTIEISDALAIVNRHHAPLDARFNHALGQATTTFGRGRRAGPPSGRARPGSRPPAFP